MKKVTLFYGCLLLASITVSAQSVNVDMTTERALMSKNISNKIEAKGSPYIQSDFEPIKVSGFENQNYRGRYNAHNGEMEVKLDDNNIIALDPEGNNKVTFTKGNRIYQPFSYYTPNNKRKRGYLVVLNESENAAVLKREVIKFYEEEAANSSYQNAKPAQFKRSDDEYYIMKDNNITYFPDNKKELAKAFPQHANGIKSLVKSEKLSYKKEADLIKIANFIITN